MIVPERIVSALHDRNKYNNVCIHQYYIDYMYISTIHQYCI